MTDEAPKIELNADAWQLWAKWEEACDAVESWEDRRDKLAAMLMAHLPDRARACVDGQPVFTVVPAREGERFDQKAFHEANPDEWNRWLVPQHFGKHLRRAPKPKQ